MSRRYQAKQYITQKIAELKYKTDCTNDKHQTSQQKHCITVVHNLNLNRKPKVK